MTDQNTIFIIDSDEEEQTLSPTPRQEGSVFDLDAVHIDLTEDDELPEKEIKQDTFPVEKASAKRSSGKIVPAAISGVSALISSKKGAALVLPNKWNSASNLEERSSNAHLKKLITSGPQQKLSLSRSALLRTNSGSSKKPVIRNSIQLKRTLDTGEPLIHQSPPPPPKGITRSSPPSPERSRKRPPAIQDSPERPSMQDQRRQKVPNSPFSKPTVPPVVNHHSLQESNEEEDLDSFMNTITACRKIAPANTGPKMTNMMCPICKSLFPKNELAEHASDCTGKQVHAETIVAEAVKVISVKRGTSTKSIASAVELDESERKSLNKGKIDTGPTNYYADSESVLALDGSGFNAEVTRMTWEFAGSTTFGG